MSNYGVSGASEFFRQAGEFLDKDQYPLALNMAKERMINHPGDHYAMIVLCRSLLGLGRLDEAVAAFYEVEPLNREIAKLLKFFGDAYRSEGKNQQAMTFYQRSMSLAPDVAEQQELNSALAELMDDDGLPDQEAGGGGGGEGFQTLTMADLYIRQGHHEGAREILAAILSRDPDHAEARKRLDELLTLLNEKIIDLPVDKKTTVVHELSRWLTRLNVDHHNGG